MIEKISTPGKELRVQEKNIFGYERNKYPCKTGRFAI